MSKMLLTAFAAVMILANGSAAGHAAATTSAAASAPRAAGASLVREAAIVCGGNGCNPVHTQAQRKHKFQTLGHG